MFTIHRVISLASVLFVLSACGGGSSSSGDSGTLPPPPTTPTYSVTTSVAGSGSGSISPTSRSVTQGSTTSFTISPASGSTVASVSGCGGSMSGTTYTTGQITANCTVTASFEASTTNPPPGSYTVSTTVSGGGSGTISPGSVNVIPGGSASFNIFSDESSLIGSVSGCAGTLNGTTYVTGAINATCTVAVTFNLTSYNVSTAVTGGGLIAPAFQNVEYAKTATFTLTPDEGYTLDSVQGCGGSVAGSTFTTGPITSDCEVAAVFELNRYTLTATAGENGSISPATINADHGATVNFSVIPDIGYEVETIGGCGGALLDSTYTTAPITNSCSVGVSFAPLVAVGRWDVKVIGRLDPNDDAVISQLSEDGSTVLGLSFRFDPVTSTGNPTAYRWTEARGFETIILEGDTSSVGQAISRDGSVIVGLSRADDGTERGFIWREGFGNQPITVEGFTQVGSISMSADGSIAWAELRSNSDWAGVIWTAAEGWQLPAIGEGARVQIYDGTPDGAVLVGTIYDTAGVDAFAWNRADNSLARFKLEGTTSARAVSVSDDGLAVAGSSCGPSQPSSCRAFYWTAASGIIEILPADALYAEGREIAAGGSAIVGQALVFPDRRAFRWTPEAGIEYLLYEGDSAAELLWLSGPQMSADGNTVVARSCGIEGSQFRCRGSVRQEGKGVQLLIPDPGVADAEGMSSDGRVIVGAYGTDTDNGGFVWTQLDGFEPLVLQAANAVSADGSVIGGLLCNPETCEPALLTAK
jgi:uncharacterized membrane protein